MVRDMKGTETVYDSTAPAYELQGNCLRVSGEHGPENEEQFEDALNGLLDSGANPKVIDMSAVTYVSSGYIRMLAFAVVRAKKTNSQLIIKANRRVVRLLQMGGIDKIGTVELVNGD